MSLNTDSVEDDSSYFFTFYSSIVLETLAGTVFCWAEWLHRRFRSRTNIWLHSKQSLFLQQRPPETTLLVTQLRHFATSFMQNVTISMLSGNIYYGLSNDTATNLQYVNSTCSSLETVYVYNSARLLSAYGVTLGVTAVVIACGWRLIHRNGVEQKLVFSDIIRTALNEEMFCISGKVQLTGANTGTPEAYQCQWLFRETPSVINRSSGGVKPEELHILNIKQRCASAIVSNCCLFFLF